MVHIDLYSRLCGLLKGCMCILALNGLLQGFAGFTTSSGILYVQEVGFSLQVRFVVSGFKVQAQARVCAGASLLSDLGLRCEGFRCWA